jgi:DNA-binding NarL/FixJ family response regulator
MVVAGGGVLVEANALARTLLGPNGTSLIEELVASAASGREHEQWTFQAVDGEGPRAFMCTLRSAAVVARESSVPASFAATEWRLTARQREILFCVVEGKANRAIAELLGIAERTVEAHLTTVFEKAKVASRAALIGRVFTLC